VDVLFEAIVKEFDSATFRVHFPDGSYVGKHLAENTRNMFKMSARKYPTIEFELTTDYKTRTDLIKWLAESDLNLFLWGASRDTTDFGNIPAAPDQAIAARRPLAFNRMRCSEHLSAYIEPYPDQSLRDAMKTTVGVEQMYEAWSPEAAIEIFDTFMGRVCST